MLDSDDVSKPAFTTKNHSSYPLIFLLSFSISTSSEARIDNLSSSFARKSLFLTALVSMSFWRSFRPRRLISLPVDGADEWTPDTADDWELKPPSPWGLWRCASKGVCLEFPLLQLPLC